MPAEHPTARPSAHPFPGDGRVAVVTGASSGIGAATARRLAADGFTVVLGARRMDRLMPLAQEIGGTAVELDVTDDASVASFAAGLERVDVLVNNAGGAFDAAPVAEADLDSWSRSFEVNVLGTVRVTKALLPALRASGAGDVVFVGSTAGMLAISVAAIGIFSAYMLYDLKQILDGGETNYISATLALYLDLFNVFQSLLALLGIMGGERE